MPTNKISIILILVLILILNAGLFAYIVNRNNQLQKEIDDLKQNVNSVVKDVDNTKPFKWVDEYVEVKQGDINWAQCKEESGRCVFWEDFSLQEDYPKVLVKLCDQQGTSVEDGLWTTGVTRGEHNIVGITVRPCANRL